MKTEGAVLGVDIGGVIIDRANDQTDTSFFRERYLETTPVADVFEVLFTLSCLPKFSGRIYLVSKCGKAIEEKTWEWLDAHNFWNKTGISQRRVKFCTERREKAGICKRYGITHFIDDRLEVLGYLQDVPHRYLFRPREAEVTKFASFMPGVTRVESWKELLEHM